MKLSANFQLLYFLFIIFTRLRCSMAHIIPSLPSLSPISSPVMSNGLNCLPSTLNLSLIEEQEAEIKIRGRPQSQIRSWFIPHYVNPSLKGALLKRRNNILKYECPACHKEYRGYHINELKAHVRDCNSFPQKHKSMCTFPYICHPHHYISYTHIQCFLTKQIYVLCIIYRLVSKINPTIGR